MTGFTLYPAIDLKQGRVVRLQRGDMAQATIYAEDPAEQAKAYPDAGDKPWQVPSDWTGSGSDLLAAARRLQRRTRRRWTSRRASAGRTSRASPLAVGVRDPPS